MANAVTYILPERVREIEDAATRWNGLPTRIGTADAVVAAGLVARHQIPREPGCVQSLIRRFNLAGREVKYCY